MSNDSPAPETTPPEAPEQSTWNRVLQAVTDGFSRLESQMTPEPEPAPAEEPQAAPVEAPETKDPATLALQSEVEKLRGAMEKLQSERDALRKAQDDARDEQLFSLAVQDQLKDSPIAPGAESDVEARVRAHGFGVEDGEVRHPQGETLADYITTLRDTGAPHLFRPPVGAPTDRTNPGVSRGATVLRNPSDKQWHEHAAQIATGEVVVQWDGAPPSVIH